MSYNTLKELIAKRREWEKENLPNLDKKYQTTVNFQDVNGKSLLHYAAEEGLLDEAQKLVTETIDGIKADINLKTVDWPQDAKSPLELALQSGNLNIAKYLYEQGATSPKKLIEIQNAECRNWYLSILSQEDEAK